MVQITLFNVRWTPRHRTYFIICGIVILCLQVILAVLFFIVFMENDTKVSRKIQLKQPTTKNEYNIIKVDTRDNRGENIGLNYNNFELSNRSIVYGEELGISPPCDIVTKEAVSAIYRSKSKQCKQLIANVSCLNDAEELYPKHLPHLCPNNDMKTGRHLGCYYNSNSWRLLSSAYYNLSSRNSHDYCIYRCLQGGYSYAGVQLGVECLCGNEAPSENVRILETSCDTKCPANSSQICGGYRKTNIFETGVASFKPQTANEGTIDNPSNKLGNSHSVRIVYLLTLNGRSVRQVFRLIKVLFRKDNFFFIHVDARQDYLFRELLPLEKRLGNVRLSRRRHTTIWGGASLLTMLLESMTELIRSDWNWDFIINLSESDFPIKSNEDLVAFLSANRDYNFVKSHKRDVHFFIHKQGLDKTFVECDQRMWRIGDRTLPSGIVIDGGSDWITLSRPFVYYVISMKQSQLIRGLLKIFRQTLLPAETFFHTVLRNTQFCNSYVDNNLHVTNWKRRFGCKCQYRHIVDWCGCSPNVFTIDDWPKLLNTEQAQLFFARKFDPVVCQAVLDKIEEWLYNHRPELTNQHSYWLNMYHHHDLSPSVDDSLMTVSSSLTRLALKQADQQNMACPAFTTPKLIQVHSYHERDRLKGVLVEYENRSSYLNQTQSLETWFGFKTYFEILKPESVTASRIVSMIVNSNYDVKEQMSRNFLRAMGPHTEPVLIYQVLSGTATNITIFWIDPAEIIADVNVNIRIEEEPSIQHVNPDLKPPILPGIWRLNVLENNETVAQVKFLISPLEFISGHSIDSVEEASSVNGGSVQLYKGLHRVWKHLLPEINEIDNREMRITLKRKTVVNAKRTGMELKSWIDSLVSKFYNIQDTCIIEYYKASKCGEIDAKFCGTSFWSSHAPDPKSEVTVIDGSIV